MEKYENTQATSVAVNRVRGSEEGMARASIEISFNNLLGS